MGEYDWFAGSSSEGVWGGTMPETQPVAETSTGDMGGTTLPTPVSSDTPDYNQEAPADNGGGVWGESAQSASDANMFTDMKAKTEEASKVPVRDAELARSSEAAKALGLDTEKMDSEQIKALDKLREMRGYRVDKETNSFYNSKRIVGPNQLLRQLRSRQTDT